MAEAMFVNMMRAGEGPSDRAVIDYATFLIERGRMQEAEGILERIDDESPDSLARLALMGMSLLDKGAAGGAA